MLLLVGMVVVVVHGGGAWWHVGDVRMLVTFPTPYTVLRTLDTVKFNMESPELLNCVHRVFAVNFAVPPGYSIRTSHAVPHTSHITRVTR